MSLAKIHTVTKARKDQGTCEKCHTPLPAGSAYRWFTVGFRSTFKHVRCTDYKCNPLASDLESSKIAAIYAAQEEAEDTIASAVLVDDMRDAIEAVRDAITEVAEEYREASTDDMGNVFNPDSEERADTLDAAAESLDWDPDMDEPEACSIHTENIITNPDADDAEDDKEDDDDRSEECDCQERYDTWLDETRTSAIEKINDIELP